MTRESVSAWTTRRPFVPFVLRITGGKEYVIKHPEFAIPTLDCVLVGIADRDAEEEKAIARVKFVSMLHIVEILPYEAKDQRAASDR
jgi:hypothetical protein